MDVQPRIQSVPTPVLPAEAPSFPVVAAPLAEIPKDHALAVRKSTALVKVEPRPLIPYEAATRGSLGASLVAGVVGTVVLVANCVATSIYGACTAIGSLVIPAWKRYTPPSLALPAAFPKPAPVLVDNVAKPLKGMAFHSDHDVFYDGHFTMPGRTDACVSMEQLLAKPNWVEIIQNNLTTGKPKAGDPIRIFIPGLNTPVDDSVKRVGLYAKFTGLPMAQIQNGATTDFGNLEIPFIGGRKTIPGPVRDWFQIGVQVLGVHPSGTAERLGFHELAYALSQLEHGNVELINRLQKLLTAYVDHPNPPKMELMPYSESTVALALAMKTLKARYLSEKMESTPLDQRKAKLKELEKHFDERMHSVFVCSIGSGSRGYGKTTAQIAHLYGWGKNKDRLVEFLGPLRIWKPVRAVLDLFGKNHDALLPFEHPFPGFDAHNFIATGSHALKLYLEKNNANSLSDLYATYQQKKLVAPSLDEVTALIKVNKAEKYRWFKGPLGWGGL